jgi:hypothetical protein
MTETLTLLQAQTLASLTPSDIIKVYSGRPNSWGNHCRCGCQGTYRYSSGINIKDERGYDGDPEDINDRQVAKVLGILQANAATAKADDDCAWFDVTVDSGRCYTIYVKAVRS